MEEYEQLKLENQICFPLYAASRLVTKMYTPYLKELGVTYPQYLILLVLWEYKELSVMEIGKKLYLSTNTLTPLLKRMEGMEIINRLKSPEDERKIVISLTTKGEEMKRVACSIPQKLTSGVSEGLSLDNLKSLKENLDLLLNSIG